MLKTKDNAAEKTDSAKKPKKQKPEKEPQYYRSATNMQTRNYQVYYMTALEKIAYFLMMFAVGAFVGYLFYGGIGLDEYGRPTTLTHLLNFSISIGTGTVLGLIYLPIKQRRLIAAQQAKLKQQFRNMLEAISTSFGAGKNIRDAFFAVQQDMESQFEEGAFIVKELQVINAGLSNGITIEEMLKDLGLRSGCEDIMDFANVFEICYRKGGNINQVVHSTYAILSDKMAISEEIETIVNGSKNEQNLMLIMPVLLIGMIKFSSPDFAANFATPMGILATTGAMVIFAASYFVGKKILDIKI